MAMKSVPGPSVSQMLGRLPYHAVAHGMSVIVNSSGFIQSVICWIIGGW